MSNIAPVKNRTSFFIKIKFHVGRYSQSQSKSSVLISSCIVSTLQRHREFRTLATVRVFETDVWQEIDDEWKVVGLHYSEIVSEDKKLSMWRFAVLCLHLIALAACGGGGGGDRGRPASTSPPTPPVSACNDAVEFCGTIPSDADPCDDDEYWPLSAESSIRPFTIHYSRQDSDAIALEMITLLEESWSVQIDMLGFTAPVSDDGTCGPDGNYDIFVWPVVDGAYVTGIAPNRATPYRDFSTYMVFNPGGVSGPAWLNTLLTHELNHAVQASDDWSEGAQHYEAGATFAEALVYPDDNDWFFEMRVFQRNPQWSLFYDDFAVTWYTYAAAMYLHYLYERFYPGDPSFYARIWRATRNDVGDDRPDYFDALRQVLLTERGVTLDETILEFMQWRWFIGEFDDGAHYARGADWPHPVAVTDIDASAIPPVHVLDAMIYGANYVRFVNDSTDSVSFVAVIDSLDPGVSWRLLDVAGGEVVGPITVDPNNDVVLVAVVLPTEEVWTGNLSFDQKAADLKLTMAP